MATVTSHTSGDAKSKTPRASWPMIGAWWYSVPSGKRTVPFPTASPSCPPSVSSRSGCTSSTYTTPICRASSRMDMIIVIASAPSIARVAAALALFGFLNAGTPLLIASTPVSAAQPDENARSSRNAPARVIRPPSNAGWVSVANRALSAIGRVPVSARNVPTAAMPRIAVMKT